MAQYESEDDEEKKDDDAVIESRNVVSFTYKGSLIKLVISEFNEEMDLDRLTYIDLNRLTAEVVTFPTILNRLGNMEAIAADALRNAELMKRISEAKFKDALRSTQSPNKDAKGSDKGWTEGQVSDKWYSSPTYLKKRLAANKAQFHHELVKSAYWAAKSKSDKLDTLSTQLRTDDLENLKSTVINGIKITIEKRRF